MRRYGRKKRVGRARRYRKGPSTKRIARVAKSVVSRAIETKEIRYAHTAVAGANFSSVGYGTSSVVCGLFGAITQAITQQGRIGSKIYARGVRIFLPIQAGDTINQLRFIIVSPKQGTPVFPSVPGQFASSVLSASSSSGQQWSYPVDTNRWRVHLDKTFFLTFDPVDGNSSAVKARTKFLKAFVKVNRSMVWDDANFITNDVYMLAISDSGAIPNPGAIGGFVTCYFKDA